MVTKSFLSILFLLLTAIAASGQQLERHEADSIVQALRNTKPGINRVELLLHLAQFHIFKPGELQKDFDSATAYINEAAVLTRSVNSIEANGYQLLTKSYLFKEKGQKEEAKQMLEKAIGILDAGANKYYMGRAYYELSTYYGYENRQECIQKIDLVEKAVDAFKQAGKLASNAYSLVMLGELYSIMDDFPKAIKVLQEALAAYQSIKYPKLQGVYILLGQAYQFQNNLSQALFYKLKALRTAHLVQDTSMQLCRINNDLGTLYLKIDNKEMSAKYLNDALEVARKHRDEYSIFLLATNISFTYNDLKQPEHALRVLALIPHSFMRGANLSARAIVGMSYLRTYTELKQHDKAQPYCDTLLRLANHKELGDQTRNNIYGLVAEYYIDKKQFAQTRYYLNKKRDMGERFRRGLWMTQDARLWYKVDSAEGNFQSAFNHLLFYKTKMDSLFSANRVKQLQVLGVEYEVAKKTDSLKLKDQHIGILTEKNTLQEANLRQAGIIKNVTMAGIALALIIIVLLYRQFLNKQKNNRIVSQKNEQLQRLVDEKEWLLKEVHHRVKNNLQTVVSLLELQSEYLSNDALAAIQASQHRIYATSLLHQKLYQDENVSSINMNTYLPELIHHLREAFNVGNKIHFKLDIAPIDLDVSQAIPVGLIANEVITNSIKYAFPKSIEQPEIVVSFTKRNKVAELLIVDNGSGFSVEAANNASGLGLKLIRGLAEDIDGSAEITSGNGTSTLIRFTPRSTLASITRKNELTL